MPAELIDSTSLLGDPRALAGRMRAEGYLYLPQLLAAPRINAVREQVLRELGALGWLEPGSDPSRALPGPEVRREGEEAWWPGYIAIQKLQDFHELAHDPSLLAVVDALVGSEALVHPRKIARVTYPNSHHPTPAHQDFPLIQGSADTFTAWMPLGDCPAEMGALRILRGSHASGLRRVQPREGVGGVGVEASDDDPDWVTTNYRAGDALIFHSFTVHWAPANEESRLRLSCDFRYQSRSDPVVEGSLHPHGWPVIPDWDELTRDWTSTASVEAPAGVEVVDFQSPMDDLGHPASSVVTSEP